MANINNANTNNTNNENLDVIIDDTTRFVNLTPHDVVLQKRDGTYQTIKSSGEARISTYFKVERIVCGIPVGKTIANGVTGLPDPTADTLFIVSALLMNHLPERHDLVAPNEQIRDEKGRVLYGKSLTS